MIQIQELLVLMQNQAASESANLRICLLHAHYTQCPDYRTSVHATQGEISDNSLITLKTVASGTLKHLRALGLAQATPRNVRLF